MKTLERMKYKVYRYTGLVIFYTVEKRGKIVFQTNSQLEAHKKAQELNSKEVKR